MCPNQPSFAAQPRIDCISFTDWTEVDIIGDDHFHQKTGGTNPNETYPTGEFFEERQVNANGLGHTNILEDWTIESQEHEACTP